MYVPDRQIDESRKYKNHRKLSGQGGVHWWEWLLTVAALHVLYPTMPYREKTMGVHDQAVWFYVIYSYIRY